jgi:hypothetical protein
MRKSEMKNLKSPNEVNIFKGDNDQKETYEV